MVTAWALVVTRQRTYVESAHERKRYGSQMNPTRSPPRTKCWAARPPLGT